MNTFLLPYCSQPCSDPTYCNNSTKGVVTTIVVLLRRLIILILVGDHDGNVPITVSIAVQVQHI